MTSLRIAACAVLLSATSACGQSAAGTGSRPYPLPEVNKDGKVIAKVGEVALTTAEMERRIAQQSPFLRAQLKDPEQKKKFIENEVRVEVLAQEGWRQKLYEHPQIVAEVKRAIVQKMMKDDLAALAPKVEISDQELADAYAKRESEYSKPEKVRLSEIVVRAESPKDKAAAKKKLEGIQAEIAKEKAKGNTAAFADAARKYSEDEATRRGGGDLQFLTKEDAVLKLGPAGAEQVFDKLEISASVIVEMEKGVALLEKTGKRRAVVRTLEMVKPQLRGNLLNEKRTLLYDNVIRELMKKADVEIDEKAIADVKVDMNAPTQPAAVEVEDDEK